MDPATRNRSIITGVGIGLLVLIFIGIVFLIIRGRTNFQQYDFGRAFSLDSRNFAHAEGDSIYAYSGMSFFKRDIHSGKVTILSTPQKLPTPSTMRWAGSNGVLVSFSGSFYPSTVQKILSDMGLGVTETTRKYTWYLSFQDGSLRLVDDSIITASLVAYSEKAGGFYYYKSSKTAVYFYDIAQMTSVPITEDLADFSLNNIVSCADDGGSVCLIGNNSTENNQTKSLYKVAKNGKRERLLESNDIHPTSRPEVFLAIKQEAGQKHELSEEEEYAEGQAYAFNISDKALIDLGFKLHGNGLATYFYPSGDFYILNLPPTEDVNSQGFYTYRSGHVNFADKKAQSKEYDLTLGTNISAVRQVTSATSYGNDGVSLLSDIENVRVLFAKTGQLQTRTRTEPLAAQKIVERCSPESNKATGDFFEESGLFRVFIYDNDQFGATAAAFSQCVEKENVSILADYNFYLGTLDPVNGRITSD